MTVRIDLGNIIDHRLLLFGRLGVLFTQIPVESEVVPEAGDQFAAIEFSLETEVSTIETFGDIIGFRFPAF